MSATSRRISLYGLGSIAVGVLVWAGFVYTAPPDALTLLSGAEIRLQQAAMIKAADKQGKLTDTYAELLKQAKLELGRADAAYPGLGMVHYYRGYIAYLEGRFAEAAAEYASARQGREMSPQQLDQTVINQALMLRHAGQNDEAVEVLAAHQERFTPELAERGAQELASARSAASVVPAEATSDGSNRGAAAQDPASPTR